VAGAVDADHLGLVHAGEPAAGLLRAQVVVQLGHQGDQRTAVGVPGVEVGVGGAVQRRRQQDRALDHRVQPVHERELGTEGPADQPRVRQVTELGELDGGVHVEALAAALVEGALAGAARAGRAAGVEPEHGDVGQRRQPPGRLAQHVRVHVAAVRGQRVQGDQGRGGCARGAVRVDRQGELADQGQAVGGVQLDVLAVRGQDGQGTDRGGGRGGHRRRA
jgi:hypothetical protein